MKSTQTSKNSMAEALADEEIERLETELANLRKDKAELVEAVGAVAHVINGHPEVERANTAIKAAQ